MKTLVIGLPLFLLVWADFETPQEWRLQALAEHNELRKGYESPPLQHNESLCKSSQRWANLLVAKKVFGHSHTEPGENIWSGTQHTAPDAKQVVDDWYSEIQYFDFDNVEETPCEIDGKITCHFTQVVWKGTDTVCTSYAVGTLNLTCAVAQYWPAGNGNPEFAANIIVKRNGNKFDAKDVNQTMLGVYAYKRPKKS